jgi:hypothetical protein
MPLLIENGGVSSIVTLQRMQELNPGSTAAILCDETGNEPPTPSPGIELPRSPGPLVSSILRTPVGSTALAAQSAFELLRSPGPLVSSILRTPAGNAALVASPPAFDRLSFVKYMKYAGREYRREAMTSISLCQTFIKAQMQTRSSYEESRRYCSQIIPLILGPVQLFQKCATGR